MASARSDLLRQLHDKDILISHLRKASKVPTDLPAQGLDGAQYPGSSRGDDATRDLAACLLGLPQPFGPAEGSLDHRSAAELAVETIG